MISFRRKRYVSLVVLIAFVAIWVFLGSPSIALNWKKDGSTDPGTDALQRIKDKHAEVDEKIETLRLLMMSARAAPGSHLLQAGGLGAEDEGRGLGLYEEVPIPTQPKAAAISPGSVAKSKISKGKMSQIVAENLAAEEIEDVAAIDAALRRISPNVILAKEKAAAELAANALAFQHEASQRAEERRRSKKNDSAEAAVAALDVAALKPSMPDLLRAISELKLPDPVVRPYKQASSYIQQPNVCPDLQKPRDFEVHPVLISGSFGDLEDLPVPLCDVPCFFTGTPLTRFNTETLPCLKYSTHTKKYFFGALPHDFGTLKSELGGFSKSNLADVFYSPLSNAGTNGSWFNYNNKIDAASI